MFRKFLQKSHGERVKFCRDVDVSFSQLREAVQIYISLRKQCQMTFRNRGMKDVSWQDCNANSQNIELVRSLLCAAYPGNLACSNKVTTHTQHGQHACTLYTRHISYISNDNNSNHNNVRRVLIVTRLCCLFLTPLLSIPTSLHTTICTHFRLLLPIWIVTLKSTYPSKRVIAGWCLREISNQRRNKMTQQPPLGMPFLLSILCQRCRQWRRHCSARQQRRPETPRYPCN